MATFILIDPDLRAAHYTQVPGPYTTENFSRLLFGGAALVAVDTDWRKTKLILPSKPKIDPAGSGAFTLGINAYATRALLARYDEGEWRPIKLSIGDVRDAVGFP